MAENLLSANERFKIRTYHLAGLTNEEIAEKAKVTVRDVEIELQKLGLKAHERREPAPSEFATKQSIPQPTSSKSGLWGGEKGLKLKELYLAGKTNAEIADELKLTTKQVSQGLYLCKNRGIIPREGYQPKTVPTNGELHDMVRPQDPVTELAPVPKKLKIPQSVIELVKNELEALKSDFAPIEKEYNEFKQEIAELEEFLKENNYEKNS